MIDSTKVLIATPTIDGRVEAGYAGGLMAVASEHLIATATFLISVSHIGLARNLLAHTFLLSKMEWLIFVDSDISFSANDFRLLMDYPVKGIAPLPHGEESRTSDGEVLISCAQYSKKIDALETTNFGLGFCKIHRSVFDRMIDMVDFDGTPRIGQFINNAEMHNDFFASGPGFDGIWFGEDSAFFHLCRFAGIVPRIEKRTKLIHIGRKAYPYTG